MSTNAIFNVIKELALKLTSNYLAANSAPKPEKIVIIYVNKYVIKDLSAKPFLARLKF